MYINFNRKKSQFKAGIDLTKKPILEVNIGNQTIKVLGGITVPYPADAIRLMVDGVDMTDMFGFDSKLEIFIEQVPKEAEANGQSKT